MLSAFCFTQTFIGRIISQAIETFSLIEIEIASRYTMFDSCGTNTKLKDNSNGNERAHTVGCIERASISE